MSQAVSRASIRVPTIRVVRRASSRLCPAHGLARHKLEVRPITLMQTLLPRTKSLCVMATVGANGHANPSRNTDRLVKQFAPFLSRKQRTQRNARATRLLRLFVVCVFLKVYAKGDHNAIKSLCKRAIQSARISPRI